MRPDIFKEGAKLSKVFDYKKDIGSHSERIASQKFSTLSEMESEKSEALGTIHNVHGTHQVS